MKEKIFFDSNIFIYAADKESLFYNESVGILTDSVETGFFTSDLCCLEFYQVITDGRKTPKPLSPENALLYIKKLWDTPEIDVLEADILGAFLEKEHQENLIRYNITRFDIYDYLIAACLKKNQIRKIVTFNSKDFRKYPWLTVVDPRENYDLRKSAPSAMPPARPVEFNEDDSVSYSTGAPCASRTIPYGRQSIDEKDVAAVCSALRSDWLTTGPKVEEFEHALADYVGAKYAVAVSSGTAALYAAMFALGIGPGDEVIVPTMTFAATANCVVYQGGTPVFADVDPDTLLIDPEQMESKITRNTRAIIGVDYAGQPCDWDALRKIAHRHDLHLVDDGCHSLGAEYKGKKIGTLANMTIFSFHPVKHITTGEGGMIVTDDPELAENMRIFRNHGITTDHRQRESQGSWFYAMEFLGYNYRITDFQCALGISQLKKLPKFLERRHDIAALYDEALSGISSLEPLRLRADVLSAAQSARRMVQNKDRPSSSSSDSLPSACSVEFTEGDSAAYSTWALCSLHGYHLYVVRLDGIDRSKVFKSLRKQGIGVNVHYIPVHLHPFYRDYLGDGEDVCPNAEAAYEQIISLPMFPGMSDENVEQVVKCLKEAINKSN